MTTRVAIGIVLGIGLFLASLQSGGVEQVEEVQEVAEVPEAEQPVFRVTFDARLVASEKSMHVKIRLGSNATPVEWILFRAEPLRYRAFEADGELVEVEAGWEWHPPKGGGEVRYVASIDHLRDDNAYDARCTKSWAILRGEDLVPRMRVRTVPIARSDSRLRLRLPEGWSAILPYERTASGEYLIENPDTRFDRPAGWFAFGKLGVVRETIEGTRISIAGPARQGIRRMDLLALMRWTLPSLSDVFDGLPDRVAIVSAGDPMWRGGLSGPKSIYLHADRPLISEDSTSPLLHELMHSLMRARSGPDGDWVVEGLAELYSVSILRRSETLSASRYESALRAIAKRAQRGGPLRVAAVDGDTRAKAVGVLIEIDEAIRQATGGAKTLDDVVRRLAAQNSEITTEGFREVVEEIAGRDFGSLFDRYAPAPRAAKR